MKNTLTPDEKIWELKKRHELIGLFLQREGIKKNRKSNSQISKWILEGITKEKEEMLKN